MFEGVLCFLFALQFIPQLDPYASGTQAIAGS
jgi:hypothetical protein